MDIVSKGGWINLTKARGKDEDSNDNCNFVLSLSGGCIRTMMDCLIGLWNSGGK